MNKRSTVGMVLSIAATAGIAAGAVLHNATSPVTASAPPPVTTPGTSRPSQGTPGTTASTTTPTTPTTATSRPTSQSPTAETSPTTRGLAPLSPVDLIEPPDFAAADVSGLSITETHEGGPNYDMSICPDVEGPGQLPPGSRAWSRYLASATTKVTSYQLLVDFASTADADKHVRWLEDWHAACGTPQPEDPTQDISVGPIRTESIKGSDTSIWWDTAFVNEGKKLETVAFTRSGTRVSVVVFAGPIAAIQYADMTTLVGRMAEKMA